METSMKSGALSTGMHCEVLQQLNQILRDRLHRGIDDAQDISGYVVHPGYFRSFYIHLMSSAYSILHIVMISKRFNTLLLTCCWKPCRQAMLSPEFARFEKSRRLSMGRRFGTLCVARFIVIRRCSRWWWSSSNQRVGELCFQMLSGCRVGDTYYVWKSMFRELCMIKILSV